MAEGNGNGTFRPIDIDVTDETAFKSAVVQHLQLIMDQTKCIPAVVEKVNNHDQIVRFGKWLGAPVFLFLQFLFKHPIEKIWEFLK